MQAAPHRRSCRRASTPASCRRTSIPHVALRAADRSACSGVAHAAPVRPARARTRTPTTSRATCSNVTLAGLQSGVALRSPAGVGCPLDGRTRRRRASFVTRGVVMNRAIVITCIDSLSSSLLRSVVAARRVAGVQHGRRQGRPNAPPTPAAVAVARGRRRRAADRAVHPRDRQPDGRGAGRRRRRDRRPRRRHAGRARHAGRRRAPSSSGCRRPKPKRRSRRPRPTPRRSRRGSA